MIRPSEHVVLLTMDGVRWQDVFEGPDPGLLAAEPATRQASAQRWRGAAAAELLPNLYALSESEGAWVGASADAPLLASGPNFVSLPGYLEIVTGRAAHDCQDNECELRGTQTLFDEWSAARPGDRRAVFASWDGLGQLLTPGPQLTGFTGKRLSPGAEGRRALPGALSGRLESLRDTARSPGHGQYLPDAVTAELAERYLAEYRPNFLMVSLGDTDEHAHVGNYSGYLDVLHAADRVVGRVAGLLKRWENQGASVTLLVTTDHGRERSFHGHGAFAPESARSWLFAAGTGVRARGYAKSERSRRLADIAPTIRRMAGLPRITSRGGGEELNELF